MCSGSADTKLLFTVDRFPHALLVLRHWQAEVKFSVSVDGCLFLY